MGSVSGEPGPTDAWPPGDADGERYAFDGRHHTVTDSPALPKPVQRPYPPVIVGGHGPRRTPMPAARFAAEINVAFSPIDAAAAQFDRVDAACREIGRDPASIVRSTAQVIAVGRDDAEVGRRASVLGRKVAELRENGLTGSPGEVVDRLGQWAGKTIAAEVMPQLP